MRAVGALLALLLAAGCAAARAPPLVFTFTAGRTGTQRLSGLLGQCCAAAGGVCEAAHEPHREVLGNALLLRNVLGWGPEGRSVAVDHAVELAASRQRPFVEVSAHFSLYAEEALARLSAERDVTVVVLRRDLADTLASWMGAWGDRRAWDAIGRRFVFTPHAPGSATRPLRSLEDSSTGELVAGYLIDLEARLQLLRARFEPLGVRFLEVRTEDVASPAGARWLMGELGLPCPLALEDAGQGDRAGFRRAEGDKGAARAAARVLLRAYLADAARLGVSLPPLPTLGPLEAADVERVLGSDSRLAFECALQGLRCVAMATQRLLRRSVPRRFELEVEEPSNGTVVGAEGAQLTLSSDWLPERGPEPGYVRFLGVYIRLDSPTAPSAPAEYLLDALDWYAHRVAEATTLPLAFVRPFPAGSGATYVTVAIQARDCPAAHAVAYSVAVGEATGVGEHNLAAVMETAQRDAARANLAARGDYMPADEFRAKFGHWKMMQGCQVLSGPATVLRLRGSSGEPAMVWNPEATVVL